MSEQFSLSRVVNLGGKYLAKNLGVELPPVTLSLIGFFLWAIVVGLTIGIVADSDLYSSAVEIDQKLYIVVLVFTILTLVPTVFDYHYNRKNVSTFFTVVFGSVATFFSLGLWAVDEIKGMSTAILIMQIVANSLQLSAIFNEGRIPVDENNYVETKAFLL